MIRMTVRYVVVYSALVLGFALVIDAVPSDAPTLSDPAVIHPCALVTERDASTSQVIRTYCLED